ncbi:hypothetical protein J5N97_010553 [Dioscorea zingiberensis]|uniref:Terpene synthase N-terminal domain-containing protein n=1 Tax=Dioscorea zingiberensis TaxID=325984 RepID=A0A9D5D1E2_9LILI|nr:hypothetical protein J5N97_010553 [Dioscorea zingiberensis]
MLHSLSSTPSRAALRRCASDQAAHHLGSCRLGTVRRGRCDISVAGWRLSAISKRSIHPEYNIGLIHNGMPITEWPEKFPELGEEDPSFEVSEGERIREMVSEVKAMLSSMGDGEISISAYDTAWVALVQDIHGSGAPQFPSSLQWIVENQLSDGSWGDDYIFSAHDRMINTLACVIALKSWSICAESCDRGMKFVRENMWRIAEEDAEHMPIGFEVTFPSMVEIAKALGLDVPCDDPALQNVHAMRNLKLKRIPKDVMHKVPTTLLHSLEGMPGLDWGRLLRLQNSDGSFLFSPSSTAYALMQTGDKKCLAYLQKAVDKFNGGVPNVYPVDLFEHLWSVDRLERLGISRYFEPEIKECMDYVHRYWTKDGICWARNSPVHDVDDTSMAFRLLRLHGYDVEYALDFPWYSSLPRIETRLYLEQYGGGSDVWIGKTLYRMPYVNNDVYLELAKSDFNQCQAAHQFEWLELQKWYTKCGLAEKGVSREALLTTYFLTVASMFEPERAQERLGWVRTALLAQAVSSFFSSDSCSRDMRQNFIQEFINYPSGPTWLRGKKSGEGDGGLVGTIQQLLDSITSNTQQHHQKCQHLRRAWEKWMRGWRKEGEEEDEDGHVHCLSEGRDETGLLLVKTIEVCAGRSLLDVTLGKQDEMFQSYKRLTRLMSSVCHRLKRASPLIPQVPMQFTRTNS